MILKDGLFKHYLNNQGGLELTILPEVSIENFTVTK